MPASCLLRLRSGENRQHPLLARSAKWIVVGEPAFELQVHWIASRPKNPLDVDELAVLPHSNPDLFLQVKLVLGRAGKTSQGVACAVVKFPRHRHGEKPAACPLRHDSVWLLESIGAHGLQRQPQLQFGCAQGVPFQESQLEKNLVSIGLGVLFVLCCNLAGESLEHEGELARRWPTAGSRRPLESGIGWRRKVFQHVLSDQRGLRDRGRWWIPVEQDVAPKAEVVEQLRGSDEMVADLEVVHVPQDVDEAAVSAFLESRRAERAR